MALCPFATQKLIAPGANDPRITPTQAILHVDAGGASSLFDYFLRRSGGVESHFFVKWTGEIEQYRDTDFEADANYRANPRAISIETQGFGLGKWNLRQLAAIKMLLGWLHETHPAIPLVECPGPFEPGIGYHTMWGAPSDWTPVAKSCPGPNRIIQFNDEIVPWLKAMSKPPKKYKLRVVSANIWRENKHVAEDLGILAETRAHIIGLNEGKALVDKVGLHVVGYRTIVAERPGAAHQNPILVREDVELLGFGSRKMCSAVNRSPERWATWVEFEHGGVRFAYVNTHMNSHVQEGKADPHELPRVKEYVEHAVRLRQLVKDLRAKGFEVIVGGDLNWSWTRGPLQWFWSPKRVFFRLGLRIQWAHKTAPEGGSHGRRRIDYLAHSPAHLIIHGQRLVKGHSDHLWPEVTYEVR